MTILLANKFFYPKGGAEVSFFATARLLESKGHKVVFLSMEHPDNLPSPHSKYFLSRVEFEEKMSFPQAIKATARILYSLEAKRKMDQLVRDERPDIVHLNNIHHQISPSILHVAKKWRLPVVLTLRDYKMVCPAYAMLSDSKPCEKCKSGRYYWCVLKRCIKGSFPKSMVAMTEMYLHHKILHIYNLVDIFIAPSIFLKQKLVEMGFKHEIVHLPNFVHIADFVPCYDGQQGSLAFFGRLSEEKGLFTLLDAVKGLPAELTIIGEGPVGGKLRQKAQDEKLDNVHFLGYKSAGELREEIRRAMAVVLPSECYENNPRSVIEAFALGKPVIGARIGGIPELVRDGETGLTFEPGNAEDLRKKIEELLAHPDMVREMGVRARRFVEEQLSPEVHYERLIQIYQSALERTAR